MVFVFLGVGLAVLVLGVGFVGWTRMRRHGEASVPAAGWQPTEESFRDPSTGRMMRVWVDPVDGSRHYIAEGGPPGRR